MNAVSTYAPNAADLAQADAIRRRQARDAALRTAAANMRSGGSFAQAISDAYFAADSANQKRLVKAFADLFSRFAA